MVSLRGLVAVVELVIVAAPHDDLVGRFVADLKTRGLLDSRLPERENRHEQSR
jgi:hypothetical protein